MNRMPLRKYYFIFWVVLGLGLGMALEIFIQHVYDTGKVLTKASEFETGRVLLKRLIIKDYPALAEDNTTDWDKVNLLRQWVHENVLFATESQLLDKDGTFNYYMKDAPTIFSAFFASKGGVWCGGAAYALMRLYQSYGFDAYTYNYGVAGLSTHVVVLVRLVLRGKSILSIQDPMFDTWYVNSRGDPYDLFEVLELLKKRRHDLIKMKQGSGRPPDVLVHPIDRGTHSYSSLILPEDRPTVSMSDGRLKYIFRINPDAFLSETTLEVADVLKKNSLPANPVYLLLYPININDGTGEVSTLWQGVSRVVGHLKD